jgi:hypothetical protein
VLPVTDPASPSAISFDFVLSASGNINIGFTDPISAYTVTTNYQKIHLRNYLELDFPAQQPNYTMRDLLLKTPFYYFQVENFEFTVNPTACNSGCFTKASPTSFLPCNKENTFSGILLFSAAFKIPELKVTPRDNFFFYIVQRFH